MTFVPRRQTVFAFCGLFLPDEWQIGPASAEASPRLHRRHLILQPLTGLTVVSSRCEVHR
jgi:hypothetical protein